MRLIKRSRKTVCSCCGKALDAANHADRVTEQYRAQALSHQAGPGIR